MIRRALSSLDESCIAETMPESYSPLKMNADAIIAIIQALPKDQEGRGWALELGTPEGKQVRYSETISALWELLEAITALQQGGEMLFRYAGILRLPDGPSFSRTFEGQQIFPFGDIERITEALLVERQNQQDKSGLIGQDEAHEIDIFE